MAAFFFESRQKALAEIIQAIGSFGFTGMALDNFRFLDYICHIITDYKISIGIMFIQIENVNY